MSLPKVLLLAAFFTISGISYLGPIIEWDFFWHLSSGREFLEGAQIPWGKFPTQWLGQAILYLVWRISGYAGIVFFRSIVYSSILVGLYFWMRREGIQYFLCIFFLLFPARIFLSFPNERPQLLTFLFFPLTIYLLENFRKKDSDRYILFLPVLFAVWGNIHGGVLAGIASLCVYFLSEVICFLRGKSTPLKLGTIGAVTIAPLLVIALLNTKAIPSMAGIVMSFFAPGAYMESIMEYLPPYKAATGLKQYYPSYWAFLALTIITSAARIRRLPLHQLLLLLLFAGLSFRSLRFMPFLLMLAPIVAFHSFGRKGSWENEKPLFAVFSAILLLWLLVTPIKVQPGLSKDFPINGASFLKRTLPSGKIFNYHGWAGFLVWELEDREIFMPAQGITDEIDEAYEKIIWSDSLPILGKPQWKALLDAYRIEIVVIPGISPVSGNFFPLLDSLVFDPEWSLVSTDDTVNIFLRNSPEHNNLLSIYTQPGINAYKQVIEQATRYLKERPEQKALWYSLGYAYGKLGMEKESEDAYRMADKDQDD